VLDANIWSRFLVRNIADAGEGLATRA